MSSTRDGTGSGQRMTDERVPNDRDGEIATTIIAYLAAARRGEQFDLDAIDPELRNEVEDLLPIMIGAMHSADAGSDDDGG